VQELRITREVLDAFVNVRILTPSVGGYAFHPENL